MSISKWEEHTLLADIALQEKDHLRSVLHYQQALYLSERLIDEEQIDADDLLTINVISCHNMANFWRTTGDSEYEFKYLQLASERLLMLVPQCPNKSCSTFIDSLGCCQKALINYMKRHPNTSIAKRVQHINTVSNCELIAKFKLN